MTLSLVPAAVFTASAADNSNEQVVFDVTASVTEGSNLTVKGTTTFSDIMVYILDSDGDIYYPETGVSYAEFAAGFEVPFPEGTAGTYTLVAGRDTLVNSMTITVSVPATATPDPEETRRPSNNNGGGSSISFGGGGNPAAMIGGEVILRDYAFGQGLFSGNINQSSSVRRNVLKVTEATTGLSTSQKLIVTGNYAFQPDIRYNSVNRNNDLYGFIPAKLVLNDIEVPGGKNPIKMVAYDVAADGSKTVYKKSSYDAASKTMEVTAQGFGDVVLVQYNEVNFTDLDAAAWATDYIYGLAAREIVSGQGDGTFDPNRSVTRAEFVKMVMMGLDLYEKGDRASTYSDVAADAWYRDIVAAAAEAGIVTGYEDGTFGAERTISRQEMATIALRAFEQLPVTLPGDEDVALTDKVAAQEFGDQWAIADWAADAVSRMQRAGIINGTESGDFDPDANATRAEASKIIWGLFELTF